MPHVCQKELIRLTEEFFATKLYFQLERSNTYSRPCILNINGKAILAFLKFVCDL